MVVQTEPNTEMMQSVEEHEEVPKEDTAVMPVREPRKQRRVQNPAAESHQKKKVRNREIMDQPPPKWKNKLHMKSRICGSTGHSRSYSTYWCERQRVTGKTLH
jgi:hypothetical protein